MDGFLQEMTPPLRFGFIGCGQTASSHAKVVQALGHRIAAVAAREGSPRLKGFSQAYEAQRCYSDFGQMLKKEDLDALVVAVSWNEMEPVAREVLKCGIPVLLEKPLALSAQGAAQILELSRARQETAMVGYNRRFYDFIPELKTLIKNHRLLSVELSCPDAFQVEVTRLGEDLREHYLFYKTSHWLDLATYLVGPLKVLEVFSSRTPSPSWAGLLLGAGKVPTYFQAHLDAPAQVSLTFHFEGFICQLKPAEEMRLYEGIRRLEPTESIPYHRFEPILKKAWITDSTFKPGFLNQMRHFVQLCVERRPIPRVGCSIEEVLPLTKLCEEIHGGVGCIESEKMRYEAWRNA